MAAVHDTNRWGILQGARGLADRYFSQRQAIAIGHDNRRC